MNITRKRYFILFHFLLFVPTYSQFLIILINFFTLVIYDFNFFFFFELNVDTFPLLYFVSTKFNW